MAKGSLRLVQLTRFEQLEKRESAKEDVGAVSSRTSSRSESDSYPAGHGEPSGATIHGVASREASASVDIMELVKGRRGEDEG